MTIPKANHYHLHNKQVANSTKYGSPLGNASYSQHCNTSQHRANHQCLIQWVHSGAPFYATSIMNLNLKSLAVQLLQQNLLGFAVQVSPPEFSSDQMITKTELGWHPSIDQEAERLSISSRGANTT